MNQVEPSRLQSLALNFADKASTFVENNEKLLDFRTGGYGFKYEGKDKNGRPWEDRQTWDRERSYRRTGAGRRNYENREQNANGGGYRSERRW